MGVCASALLVALLVAPPRLASDFSFELKATATRMPTGAWDEGAKEGVSSGRLAPRGAWRAGGVEGGNNLERHEDLGTERSRVVRVEYSQGELDDGLQHGRDEARADPAAA